MKLSKGMYVRTKNGYIDKILDILEEWYCLGEDEENKSYKIYKLSKYYYDEEFDEDNKWVLGSFLTKASHNIIDLIEVGDYVNGEKVIRIYEKGECYDGSNYGLITKTIETENDNYENIPHDHLYVGYSIKSIVTKECFESMQYEVK